MTPIRSQLQMGSAEARANRSAMEQALERVQQAIALVEDAAESTRPRYQARNMLMPRDRLSLLLDRDAPFLELGSLAGYRMDDDRDGRGAGGGCIAGLGRIRGIPCVVVVDNFAVKGGTVSPMGLKKKLRMQQIALENHLPLVTLAQSGGANLNYAAETFVEGGRAFANQARLSAAGIPQLTLVHGSATAGGAYQPGLSDCVIMVRGQATMYLAGPHLLKAATGEVADDESLGGAEMHLGQAGSGEYLAEDDRDAIRQARALLPLLAQRFLLPSHPPGQPPRYPAEELLAIVPGDPRRPYDVREILARLADDSGFIDFKTGYDRQTVCGHMALDGQALGVIGNNGPITAQGAAKAAQFIQLCQQGDLPLLFVHNTTGFMVGTRAEQSGIIKHGSRLIQAVANATVPKLSLMVGGSYGAGNYAMCGRGLDPRFILAWPNSRTAVMGPVQAGQVLRSVTQARMARAGQVDPEALDALQRQTEAMMEAASTSLACSARLWDDAIIDPRETRSHLSLLLRLCLTTAQRPLTPTSFGVSR
ncbi:acyl-CoA carboxylase subunit beta [Ferrimonas sediminicola]|uniref:Acyl-CoA carboxylase subunit beta n=1 Tax=Ferrimonas sediminicola TaxID=2569538 RepID=A0A4U1BGY8_9GAMM|nr:carboxyl transferase domain-containing protein [Ferrimonas sediminicola]TKB50505.1 acyl-CoA carboxylase subunit beta [Ferrimonas sediminicola]